MELEEILQLMRKRLWLIVLGTLLVSVPAFLVTEVRGPIYEAKVTMMVNPSDKMASSNLDSLRTGEQLAQTYSELLKARPVLEMVIASLGLNLSPEKLTEDMVDTSLINGTQLLKLTVRDADPQRASDIANEIAFTFVSTHNAEQQIDGIIELEQDVTAERVELKSLIQQTRAAMERLRSSPSLVSDQELRDLQDTLSAQQSAYAGLLSTFLAIRQAQTSLFDVSIVEPAVPPTEPSGPSSLLYAAVGGIVGFSLSLGLAVLLHHLNRSFETGDDIARILSLPTLGVIPWLSDRERHALREPASGLHSAASEAYRALRTNIRFTSVDRPLKSLLVTSAEPEAGKTTVAGHLGVVCAEAGIRAILVDADLRYPEQHHRFGLDGSTGLTDLLVGDTQAVFDCMLETGMENLRLVPGGPVPPNPSELLGSNRMEAILAQLEEAGDLVILDSAPLLAVTDAAVLAPKVDGVILAIAAKRTAHEAAVRACTALQNVGATVLGVVLVGARSRDLAYYPYAKPARAAQRPARKQGWIARFLKI